MKVTKLLVAIAIVCLGTSSAANAAVLIHNYQFDGNLNDSLGGPALVALGGSLTSTPGRYDFGRNQGLQLTNGLNDISTWSLDFRVSYNSLDGTWKKLVDFRNLTSDNGLYFAGDKLQFYPVATGTTPVSINTDFTIALTRDDLGTLRGYVNGALEWAAPNETNSLVVGNVLTFFTDDFVTGQSEAQPGSVDYIRIYDGVLTASQVSTLNAGGTIPEPATLALLSVGLMGLGLSRRKIG